MYKAVWLATGVGLLAALATGCSESAVTAPTAAAAESGDAVLFSGGAPSSPNVRRAVGDPAQSACFGQMSGNDPEQGTFMAVQSGLRRVTATTRVFSRDGFSATHEESVYIRLGGQFVMLTDDVPDDGSEQVTVVDVVLTQGEGNLRVEHAAWKENTVSQTCIVVE